MAVQLRERKVKDGVTLYWDFYISGERFTETSKYKIYDDEPPSLSKKKRDSAKREGYLREMEFLSKGVDKIKSIQSKGDACFNHFLYDIRDTRKTESTRGNWGTIVKRFEEFAGKDVRFKHINLKLCQDYLDHLLSRSHEKLAERKKNAKSEKELKELNAIKGLEYLSIRTYYLKFMSAIKEAYKIGLIAEDYTLQVVGLPKDDREDKIKHIVEIDELRALSKHQSEFKNFNEVKSAFLFACFTGLRLSDCRAIKWGDIWEIDNPIGEEKVFVIKLHQRKTKKQLNIPIFESTLKIAGERKGDDDKLFNISVHASSFNKTLRKVFVEAGLTSLIKKRITSHSGRHTFAVVTRNNGVDVGILKELLGHRDMKSTEHYGRLSTSSLIGALYQRPTL